MNEQIRFIGDYKRKIGAFPAFSQERAVGGMEYKEGIRTPLRVVSNADGEKALPYQREVVGSKAFNLEYFSYSKPEEIREDIVAYLGEYRLKVKKFDYKLAGFRDSEGEWTVGDPHRKESMRKKAKRAIEEKLARGENIDREEAEHDGLLFIEDQLRFAGEGDELFWMSPPGPQEEGYGDYGYVFHGRVTGKNKDGATLAMTAVRVDNPTIEQYNTFNKKIMEKTGRELPEFHDATDFIRAPILIKKDQAPDSVDMFLRECFSFNCDDKKDRQTFQKIMKKLNPLIDQLVVVINSGSRAERISAFQSVENYALELKKRYEEERVDNVVYMDDYRPPTLEAIKRQYNQEPPRELGSCSDTKTVKSNNLLNTLEKLERKMYGKDGDEEQEWFNCPRCGFKANGPIGSGPCPGCKLTQEEFVEEGGDACA